jgi:hypothetical protein
MPERNTPHRPSWRSAALGAVGGLMVLLPLGEVLRHQSQEIQVLTAERALLDPLSQALAVQRGLLSHSELCQRVLAGRPQLEPERRQRQAVVDTALYDLKSTLSVGLWIPALAEAAQLALAWRHLTYRLHNRAVDVKTSQTEHQLLIEQTLQVMDLVTAAAPADTLGLRTAWPRAWPDTPANLSSDTAAQQAQGLALLALQNQLQLQSTVLDERLTRLRSTQAWLAGALLGLGLMAAAAGLRWRWRRKPTPTPPVAPDGVRLGPGRRSSDGGRAADPTARLMWQLRHGPSRSAAAYSDTLPPES